LSHGATDLVFGHSDTPGKPESVRPDCNRGDRHRLFRAAGSQTALALRGRVAASVVQRWRPTPDTSRPRSRPSSTHTTSAARPTLEHWPLTSWKRTK